MRLRRFASTLLPLALVGCGGTSEDPREQPTATSPESDREGGDGGAVEVPVDSSDEPEAMAEAPGVSDPVAPTSTGRCEEEGGAPSDATPGPGVDVPVPEPSPEVSEEVPPPGPNVTPTPSDPAEPAEPSEPAPVPAELPEGVEFIPWEELTMINTLGPRGGIEALGASLDVRSVADASGYEGEDFIIAVATESGDNAVVAVDVDERTFRNHWAHFPCGDCQVSSGLYGTALLTSDRLYGSSDGGYRYYEIGEANFSDRATSYVRVVNDRVWVREASGWLGAPFDGSEYLTAPVWTARGIASVDQESGLEVTARYITRHAEDGQTSNANVCASVPDISFGSAHHDGQFVVTLCDEDTVSVFDDFPNEPTEFDLDEPVTWVSGTLVATATGWYGVAAETRGIRLGGQAPLASGEQVFGHIEGDGVALRITSQGVAVSVIAVP